MANGSNQSIYCYKTAKSSRVPDYAAGIGENLTKMARRLDCMIAVHLNSSRNRKCSVIHATNGFPVLQSLVFRAIERS